MTQGFRLVIASKQDSFTHTTDKSSVKIGRSLNCDFVIPKEEFSRQHCLFECINEQYFITDLGSINGVFIDGERIPSHERRAFLNDHVITLALNYHLKVSAWEIKSKEEVFLKKLDQGTDATESATVEISLELLDSKETLKSKKRKIPKVKEEKSNPYSESLKMILGFVLILGFALYHAFGV